MSNVTLDIAGRSYTIACAAGEEAHVASLGAGIDARLASMPNLGTQSEPRTLLYAALLLADELHDRDKGEPQRPQVQEDGSVAQVLEDLAERLESIAASLESGQASS